MNPVESLSGFPCHDIRNDPLRTSADSLWTPETGGPFWRWLHSLARKQVRCNEGESRSRLDLPPAVTAAVASSTGVVLLYDRHNVKHRRLANAEAVKAELETPSTAGRALRSTAVRVSAMGNCSICELAMLFSVAQVAVFPHGGHTASVLYMPPGVQVIGLFCGRAPEVAPIQSSCCVNLMGIRHAFVRDPQAACARERGSSVSRTTSRRRPRHADAATAERSHPQQRMT